MERTQEKLAAQEKLAFYPKKNDGTLTAHRSDVRDNNT